MRSSVNKILSILGLVLSTGQWVFCQTQATEPLLSLRYHWSTQSIEDMYPLISIYENGMVILRAKEEKNCPQNAYCSKYFYTQISPEAIQKLRNTLRQYQADSIPIHSNPCQAKYPNHSVHDAKSMVIKMNTGEFNHSYWVYGDWVPKDSLYTYNPKPLYETYFYLLSFRDSLLKTNSLNISQPSSLVLFRRPILDHDAERMKKVNISERYTNVHWQEVKNHEKLEYVEITKPDEIHRIRKKIKSERIYVTLNGLDYRIFYTLSFDSNPFDYLYQSND